MGRPRRTDTQIVELARAAAQRATTVDELRAAQAVLLPAQAGATVEQTADMLGVSRAGVGRLQAKFRQAAQIGPQPLRNWGGRRNALLTPEQELAFLAPWMEMARAGGMLVVAPVREALAEQLGRPVNPSVVYGLLARHGWRKVAPDTAHPKCDAVAQDDWKKNCRKNWRPC